MARGWRPRRSGHTARPHAGRPPPSSRSRQPAIGIRASTKQALANGVFDERERFLGLSRLGFRDFGAKLYSNQLIVLSFYARLGLLEGFARILQLVFGGGDELTVRPLGGLGPHFGKPQSFEGARAKRLCPSFGLAGLHLDAAKDIGGLIHQLQGRRSLVGCRRWDRVRDVLVPPD